MAADRKQVHIGAEADRDQSSIYRFEQGEAWPRDTDLIVAAYAQDLGIDPTELWEAALKMWRQSGANATVAELDERRKLRSRDRAEKEQSEALEREAEQVRGKGAAASRTSAGKRRKAQAS